MGDRRIKLIRDVEWRVVEDEVVALNARTSTYVASNKTGAFLWPLLVEGATHADLSSVLRSEFHLEQEAAERDVAAFISGLQKNGMLEE